MTKIDKCKLCKSLCELMHSHIIPEFLYKTVYDENHRGIKLSKIHGDKKREKIQKGFREYLLCKECENKFSKYENYVASLLRSITIGNYPDRGNYLIIDDINYFYFRMFSLSMIWRASISDGDFFREVNLVKHEEKARLLLLSEEIGNYYEYACILSYFDNPRYLHGIVSNPVKTKVDGHTKYQFHTGHFYWDYYISSHSLRNPLFRWFLKPGDPLIVPLNLVSEISELQKLKDFFN